MGRLIDADKLRYKHSLNTVNTTMPQSFPCITKDEINNAPTVEAIPKDQYKADMVAILEELNLEIDEMFARRIDYTVDKIQDLIQQKINKLKGETNEKK